MIAPPVRIVQDGNRSLIIEGRVALPRLVGTKAVELATLPVRYLDEEAGEVEDYDLDDSHHSAWVMAQLAKSAKQAHYIRSLIEHDALAYSPRVAKGLPVYRGRSASDAIGRVSDTAQPLSHVRELAQPDRLSAFGLEHRGIERVSATEALAHIKAAGTVLSPHALRELERAAGIERNDERLLHREPSRFVSYPADWRPQLWGGGSRSSPFGELLGPRGSTVLVATASVRAIPR